MNAEVVKNFLQNRYNELAFTDKYILVYSLDGVVYMTICDSKLVDKVTCLDKASRGQGFSLRFRPTKKQKMMLLVENCTTLCSKVFFDDMVKESKYNKGEIAEKIVTEFFGQKWEKDSVPFTQAGDIEVDGVAYQIKYENATFTNEKALDNLSRA